jgi:hypothetical protein
MTYVELFNKLREHYRQVYICSAIVDGKTVADSVCVHSNGIMVNEDERYIKELLKDYNFKITGDYNFETITIK